LFTAGPFQNAGFKATYAFSDKVSLMAGIFNNYWNVYSSVNSTGTGSGDVSTFGAQLTVTPIKGWTAYLNFLSGKYSGTIEDLTTAYQITDAFKLGLNAANKTGAGAADYAGVALYPQLAVSKIVTLGLRGEYFKLKSTPTTASTSYNSLTVTANIKSGPLTFIPEIRFDHNKDMPFTDSSLAPSKSASQFALAAVYAF
jgi:hypothetical protein